MFVQFKDVDGDLTVVRVESILRIMVTKDKRYMLQFLDDQVLELSKESAQDLADKITGSI